MLTIHTSEIELYNEEENLFKTIEAKEYKLEHSLLSISAWESKYRRAFLKPDNQLNPDEMLDYIAMMCIPPVEDKNELMGLTAENIKEIRSYMDTEHTATVLPNDQKSGRSREIITSELIYCWMVQQQIPFECEGWNISRLLTLINVVAFKNQPPKKTSQADAVSRHRAIKQAHRSKPRIPKH